LTQSTYFQKAGYSISAYHDVNEIHKKINRLLVQPIRPLNAEALDKYLNYFNAKCKKSKEMTTRAIEFIPGGVQHNLAFNYPFHWYSLKQKVPIYMTWMGINILTFYKLVVQQSWEAISQQFLKKCSIYSIPVVHPLDYFMNMN
jgi:hypothetical protein